VAAKTRPSDRGSREHGGEDPPPLDQRQTAAYIADMTLALRVLAKRARLNFLAYLLDMAASESVDQSRR